MKFYKTAVNCPRGGGSGEEPRKNSFYKRSEVGMKTEQYWGKVAKKDYRKIGNYLK